MKSKAVLLLLIIFFLAGFLRFYKLTQAPAGFDWDEASLGYNAYSILKTGKDEYGIRFPLTIRSFEDYKPPLYVYSTIPSVAIFGLNEFAVRLPSAFLGFLTVIVVYLFVKELFPQGPTFIIKSLKFDIPSTTALLLAVSPWHLQFSRMAFEANIGLFFVVLGSWLFLRGLKNGRYLIYASLAFAATMYAYHSLRIFTPILICGQIFIFKNMLWEKKKYFFSFMIIFLILVLPVIKILSSEEGRIRFQGVSVFADQDFLKASITKIEEDKNDKIPLANLLHNRRLEYIWYFSKGYLSHFDLNFLFVNGGASPMHHPPGIGQLYFFELPLILLGMLTLLSQKGSTRLLVFFWLFAAPLASAPTRDAPNAVRSLIFLPTFQIFSALGLKKILELKMKKVFFILIFLLFLNFLYYLHAYYVDLPRDLSSYWQYGYKEAVGEVLKREGQYKKIVISTNLDQPHIFFLFYTKYDPLIYQREGGTKLDWIKTAEYQFGKFKFSKIDWDKEIKKDTLFVGLPSDFPSTAHVINKINFLDGQEAIKIVGD